MYKYLKIKFVKVLDSVILVKSGDPEENRTPVTWMKTMDPDR